MLKAVKLFIDVWQNDVNTRSTYRFQLYPTCKVSLISITFCQGHLVKTLWLQNGSGLWPSADRTLYFTIRPNLPPHNMVKSPDRSFYHGSADCWYLQLMSTLGGGPYIDVCGESQSCFSRGKFRGIAQSGLSQPQYCLEEEGGWGRRSVAPYTTQLEKDTLWCDWLHFKYQRGHLQ